MKVIFILSLIFAGVLLCLGAASYIVALRRDKRVEDARQRQRERQHDQMWRNVQAAVDATTREKHESA